MNLVARSKEKEIGWAGAGRASHHIRIFNTSHSLEGGDARFLLTEHRLILYDYKTQSFFGSPKNEQKEDSP